MIQQVVKQLEEEIKGDNRKDKICMLEEQLTENIEELSLNENFFDLPITRIFSVISKVDFSELEDNDKIIEVIQNIIKNTVKNHYEEKETITHLHLQQVCNFLKNLQKSE